MHAEPGYRHADRHGRPGQRQCRPGGPPARAGGRRDDAGRHGARDSPGGQGHRPGGQLGHAAHHRGAALRRRPRPQPAGRPGRYSRFGPVPPVPQPAADPGPLRPAPVRAGRGPRLAAQPRRHHQASPGGWPAAARHRAGRPDRGGVPDDDRPGPAGQRPHRTDQPPAPGDTRPPAPVGVRRDRPQHRAPARIQPRTGPGSRAPGVPRGPAHPARLHRGLAGPRLPVQPALPPQRLRPARHRGPVRAGRLRQPGHPGLPAVLRGASLRPPGPRGRGNQRRGLGRRHAGGHGGHRGRRGHGAPGQHPRVPGAPVRRRPVHRGHLRRHRAAGPGPGRQQFLGRLRAAGRHRRYPGRGAALPGDGPAGPVHDGGGRRLRLRGLPARREGGARPPRLQPAGRATRPASRS